MKVLHLALSGLLTLAASNVDAQTPTGGGSPIVPIASGDGGARIVPIVNGGEFQGRQLQDRPIHGGGRRVHGIGGVFVVEREVVRVIEREVVREVPAPPPEPPKPPRKPYVIGQRYASLPDGCMKLIDRGVSYYGCSGEWYRQVGSGQYLAVGQP